MEINEELFKKCYSDFQKNLPTYSDMFSYFLGDTKAQKNYKIIANQSNNKVSVNYIRKFIDEETSYILGNPITYVSKSGDKEIVKVIAENLAHWSKNHDKSNLEKMLVFSECYELYYEKEGLFCSMLLTPLDIYPFYDEYGDIEFALRFFTKKFDNTKYCDVYTKIGIQHYKVNNYKFIKIADDSKHIFSMFNKVPINPIQLDDYGVFSTIYYKIKGLEDAYETNCSDITNEISDFRNAILKVIGGKIKEDDLPRLRELGLLQSDSNTTDIDWLIKQINDTFIQNTLSRLKEDMYEICGHINGNEKLQSNTSSLTLRTKLSSLENRCKTNANALTDSILRRIKFLFLYIDSKKLKPTGLDYRDIDVKYTISIPQDDLMMAQIASQLGITELFSRKTMRSQFSFCDNPDNEEKLVEEDLEQNRIGQKLLNNATNEGEENDKAIQK